MKPFLSVVVPAYNEAKRLPTTLININQWLQKFDQPSEIIVVSDGSTDATGEMVKRLSDIISNLKFIDNKENHGKGWVVRQGMLEATGEWRLFMDADNSTSIDQFDNMLFFLKGGFDVVIGSRAVSGSKLMPAQSWYRQLFGRLGNLIIQLLVLPGIKDSQCGFKCFKGEAVQKIFPLSRINRWGFDIEALALAKKFGFKIKEMPVTWVNDSRSTVNAAAYFSTLADVFKIRWWLSQNKYKIKI